MWPSWTTGIGPCWRRWTGLQVDQGRVKAAGAGDHLADHPFLGRLEASPFDPPGADGVDRADLAELVRRGQVVVADGNWYAPSAVDAAAAVVAGLLAGKPEGVTVAEVRDALGTTRKHALPLLTLLDGRGATRRRGDVRIAGPRLGRAQAGAAPGASVPPPGQGGAGRGGRGLLPVTGQPVDVDDVGDDLTEGVGVGQEPRVVAVDQLARRAHGRAEGVEGRSRHDLVVHAPEHDDRQSMDLELLELPGEIGTPGDAARPSTRVRCHRPGGTSSTGGVPSAGPSSTTPGPGNGVLTIVSTG